MPTGIRRFFVLVYSEERILVTKVSWAGSGEGEGAG